MSQITLTDEQMRMMLEFPAPIKVCDPNGNVLAVINPEDCPEFIEDQKRRAANPGKRYSFAQVRDHLQALEEAWNREGGFDEKRMWEILEEARAKDEE